VFTFAFILFLIALGFARSSRRRHVAQLTAEQKAAITDASTADAVWPAIAAIVLTLAPLRIPLSLDHRAERAMALAIADFLLLLFLAVRHQRRLSRLGLPREYRRSSLIGVVAVYATLLVMLVVWIELAVSYTPAAATRTPNRAMQLTAPRSISPLSVATTFNLQPRALSGAVADLVSR
jgi:hypothetical protein